MVVKEGSNVTLIFSHFECHFCWICETLRHENDQLTSKITIFEAENETFKLTVTDLHNKVELANTEVTRLTNQMTQQETELSVYRKERNDLVDERDLLLKMSDRKDGHIEHLNGVVKHMEEQLQSSVEAKFEALARLAEIECKEQTIDHKEKQMNMERELLNSQIASLRENLNLNMAELMALRQETTSTAVQNDIDLKQKTEELRAANATISQLTVANQTLSNQCEENIQKLRDQMAESGRLIDHYQKECDSKIKIADLYKENCDDYQAQANEMGASVKELQRLLKETTDQCGIFETKLKERDEQHQLDLDAKVETIAQLKHELKVANEMLEKADEENSERIVDNYTPSANASILTKHFWFQLLSKVDPLTHLPRERSDELATFECIALRYHEPEADLAKEVLIEIPQQLTGFMESRGYRPQMEPQNLPPDPMKTVPTAPRL